MYVSILKVAALFLAFLLYNCQPSSAQPTLATASPNKSEWGLGAGTLNILGELDPSPFGGYNIRLFYRRDIDHYFSIRPSILYGQSFNLGSQPLGNELQLVDPDIFSAYSDQHPWFAKVKTNLFQLQLEGILELSNLNGKENFWNYFLKGGIGLYSYGTSLDLKDNSDNHYLGLLQIVGVPDPNDPNTIRGRREIRSRIRSHYDGTYETSGPKEYGKFRLGNETSLYPSVSFGAGFSYNFKNLFSVTIEHDLMLSRNDYLDAIPSLSLTSNKNEFDMVQSTQILIAIPFGDANNPPKHWINPIIEQNQRYADLEEKITSLEEKLIDTDQDGVIDFLDQEKYSKKNAVVTTKGVEIIADKNPGIEKADLLHSNVLLDSLTRAATIRNRHLLSSLPLVFFESNQAHLPLTEYSKIARIIHVLSETKEINCVRVVGHADFTGSSTYNQDLALLRAQTVAEEINRSSARDLNIQFIVETEGELNPLLKNEDPTYFMFNRYVEIKACNQ